MSFHIYTLGCKVNQYESECVIQAWNEEGISYTSDMLQADILIINSCAVTENAIKDIKKLLSTLEKKLFQGRILITGCASTLIEPLTTSIIYAILLQENKEDLLLYGHSIRSLLLSLQGQHSIIEPQQYKSTLTQDGILQERDEPFILTSSLRARATVKIHDGCSHKCTYCIIPYTRGKSKSRSLSSILKEIRGLLEAGYKEIILSGINLRQFGMDLPFPIDFWDVLLRIEHEFSSEWFGRARLRISSLEPCQLNEKALETFSKVRLLCPHLHISLQSASDAVLRMMARSHYSAQMLFSALEQLPSIWHTFALGVDIITGFPGETEDNFIETKDCIESLPLTYAHIFPYSERPLTKAPSLPHQVYPHIRKERAKELRNIVKKKHEAFTTELLQQAIPQYIIAEKNNPFQGISQYYIECKSTTPFTELQQAYLPIASHNTHMDVIQQEERIWKN